MFEINKNLGLFVYTGTVFYGDTYFCGQFPKFFLLPEFLAR